MISDAKKNILKIGSEEVFRLIKCIPFPGIENAFVVISSRKSDKGNRVKVNFTFAYVVIFGRRSGSLSTARFNFGIVRRAARGTTCLIIMTPIPCVFLNWQ